MTLMTTIRGYKQMNDEYYKMAHDVAEYLANKQGENGSFPAKSSYGETFSILLWSYFGSEFENNIKNAMDYYKQKDKTDGQFHWEFNNYALYKYYLKTKNPKAYELVKDLDLKFRGTKVTNWTLLRAITRLLRNTFIDNLKACFEIKECLLRQKGGFFLDDKQVRSFQYHCFSTALIGELFELTGNTKYKNSFLDGVNFMLYFIMPNGDTLYVGRGQEQIFGYGALLLILEYAHMLTGKSVYREKARQVLEYLHRFQRPDGSFPLVLRDDEVGYPEQIDTKDVRFLGWYAYNNYFDYLPFFGYYLIKAHEIHSSGVHATDACDEESDNTHNTNTQYLKDFIIYASDKYKAVISKPGGYWTNDMPFPYVCYNNESIFPCYGGEQFVDSIYSIEQIPLPFGKTPTRWLYFREMKYKLIKNRLIAKSKYLEYSREFDFRKEAFDMHDEIKFKKNIDFEEFYPVNIYFFELKQIADNRYETEYNGVKAEIIPSEPCVIESGEFYCARGKLKSLRERMLNVSFSKDDILKRKIRVIFM